MGLYDFLAHSPSFAQIKTDCPKSKRNRNQGKHSWLSIAESEAIGGALHGHAGVAKQGANQ